MVKPSTPPANGFVRVMRRVYNPIGFAKGYNFILFFIFGGAMLGFIFARFMYFNIPGVFCAPGAGGSNHASPGECYYYNNFTLEKIGIRLHLYCILPAGFLVVFQFVPAIRHKIILLHRMNGYLVILLLLVANAGALMIARNAFGGTLSTQLFVGFAAGATTIGTALAYYNIKRLQIDQHRAWMLRVWFYAASIITLRIILIIAATIISSIGTYSMSQSCAKIATLFPTAQALERLYPLCSDLNNYTVVRANMSGNGAEIASALNMCFGMAAWGAFVLHAFGVEVYLHLTPKESQRLRDVSYHRQMEAGMKNPGNAGLTPQRLGDAHPYRLVDNKLADTEKRPLTEPSPSPERFGGSVDRAKGADTSAGLGVTHGNGLSPNVLQRTISTSDVSNGGY